VRYVLPSLSTTSFPLFILRPPFDAFDSPAAFFPFFCDFFIGASSSLSLSLSLAISLSLSEEREESELRDALRDRVESVDGANLSKELDSASSEVGGVASIVTRLLAVSGCEERERKMRLWPTGKGYKSRL
jgi:hypothetical protein